MSEHVFKKTIELEFNSIQNIVKFYEVYKCEMCGMLKGIWYNEKEDAPDKVHSSSIHYYESDVIKLGDDVTCGEFLMKDIL